MCVTGELFFSKVALIFPASAELWWSTLVKLCSEHDIDIVLVLAFSVW